jgi:hypothetical protein
MIARPKISRNERKTTEIGASKVGNFAPFSRPGGHVAEAVALAAEQAAVAGARGTAASLAGAVAAFLHDGFLTGDPERTKVGAPGVVVYVPDFASDGRRARWAEHHGHTPIDCLGEPQALNHGLMAA